MKTPDITYLAFESAMRMYEKSRSGDLYHRYRMPSMHYDLNGAQIITFKEIKENPDHIRIQR